MRGIAGFVIGAVVFSIAGALLAATAAIERDIAEAEQHLATERFDEAREGFESAERRLGYGRWLPWLGDRTLREVRAHSAALQYWQGQYASLVPEQADPIGAVDESNVDLRLVVANAAYRARQRAATDRPSTMQALDEAVNGYLAVLRSDDWNQDAAFNYEFLVRVRDDFAKGRRKQTPPDEPQEALGQVGAPVTTPNTRKFEIYVPLEGEERTKGGEAGKAGEKQRKG